MVPYPPWPSQLAIHCEPLYYSAMPVPPSPGTVERALDPERRGIFTIEAFLFPSAARFWALHHLEFAASARNGGFSEVFADLGGTEA